MHAAGKEVCRLHKATDDAGQKAMSEHEGHIKRRWNGGADDLTHGARSPGSAQGSSCRQAAGI